ncbi:conjugal transfer protein TraB [Mesotoga sp. Brook.08.YT.4.2.5.1]|uniref:TraB/GumN family protein n=2 Tax=Mesotoga TaxID=1184396 RepID=UPI000C183388|nr:TraB/GumN family protein [Mesotoga sp. Brook.08.YT.4.2.5.4.]PNE23760.1 conjugal transfer protein TraB [Mesotoga sp. Brook.08.YT.4.2.5.1]PVD17977.1 conjugal transfer protein TraB [Mesotoga sp. Brook.08.105.5.1]RAO96829.1 conjugal transfer protein TraB [Mesotoga sp. Brook.08.YT.4.2.5.4.]RDI90577.1 conjugal transfer protein TraB [Mesotoga sp. Brook.08.YT.4.2.5.2.]
MSETVHRIMLDDKELIVIGTAHVSKNSAEEVKTIIEEEKPDSVAIELCNSRYQSMQDQDRWKKTDIAKVVKEKKSFLLLANLILSSYQKRMAKQIGIQAGQEMLQAIESAKEIGAQLVLADRDIQVTFARIWGNLGFWGKTKLFFTLVLSIFSDEKITEEDLEKMKSGDMLTSALSELSKSFPQLKETLIDERDKFLAQKIKTAPGKKVVAVVGAGHVPGLKEAIKEDQDLVALSKIPPKKKTGKIIGWTISIVIIALMVSTIIVNRDAGLDQILAWILWNGSLSALGTIAALGHPLSILTAFFIAPVSSLNPILAAGWFAGLVEALVRKPKVFDFENLNEDVSSFKGFWKNRVTKILLVVVFANVGSSVGTFIGGAEVIRIFVKSFFG